MLRLESLVTSSAAAHAQCLLGVVLSIGAAGCAEPADQSAPEEDGAPLLAQQASQATSPSDPNGVHFVSVTANGTGCPLGTSRTVISDDGLTFTTSFTQYHAIVDATREFDIKECRLAIKLRTPQQRSYSIQTFRYAGWASLDPGVVGRQTASYYFQGNPVLPDESNRIELVGPKEESYLFTDEVAARGRVWSPCGLDRDLNVRTRLEVRNGTPRRSGYLNLSTIDGAAKLVFKLQSRACPGAADPSPTTPPAGTQPNKPTASPTTRPPTAPVSSVPIAPRSDLPGSVNGPQPGDPQPATPGPTRAAPGEPTQITVLPGVVRRTDRFRVTWAPAAGASASTRYRVRFTRFRDPFGALVWESGETEQALLDVEPGRLPAGEYDVVVVAREGTSATFSAAALLRVVDAP